MHPCPGSLEIRVLHAPCHTGGHVLYLVTNTKDPSLAPILFTGKEGRGRECSKASFSSSEEKRRRRKSREEREEGPCLPSSVACLNCSFLSLFLSRLEPPFFSCTLVCLFSSSFFSVFSSRRPDFCLTEVFLSLCLSSFSLLGFLASLAVRRNLQQSGTSLLFFFSLILCFLSTAVVFLDWRLLLNECWCVFRVYVQEIRCL